MVAGGCAMSMQTPPTGKLDRFGDAARGKNSGRGASSTRLICRFQSTDAWLQRTEDWGESPRF